MNAMNLQSFVLDLAGVTFGVQAMYPRMGTMSLAFQTSAPPQEQIVTMQEDIEFERQMCARADRYLHIPDRVYGDDQLETFSVLRKTAEKLPYYNTLYMHASALAMDGQGILFSAPSRGGKSTHAALWRDLFGDRVTMINDDKPILKVEEHGVMVYGSPWNGKHQISSNTSARVKAICFLTQARENAINELTPMEALPSMLHFTHRPYDKVAMEKTMALVDQMIQKVKFYDLQVNMNPEAARMAYLEIMRDAR